VIRTYVSAKIHGITVTAASVQYQGSVSIGSDLLAAADIEPFEQVHVVNLNTGDRWVTYAIPAPERAFTLNGGGARLGVVGDRCVVMTYAQADDRFPGAKVVFCDAENHFRRGRYPLLPTGLEHDAYRPVMDGPDES